MCIELALCQDVVSSMMSHFKFKVSAAKTFQLILIFVPWPPCKFYYNNRSSLSYIACFRDDHCCKYLPWGIYGYMERPIRFHFPFRVLLVWAAFCLWQHHARCYPDHISWDLQAGLSVWPRTFTRHRFKVLISASVNQTPQITHHSRGELQLAMTTTHEIGAFWMQGQVSKVITNFIQNAVKLYGNLSHYSKMWSWVTF